MNVSANFRVLALVLWCGFGVMPSQAMADDIDIFLGSSGGDAAAANVIFMLSNNSNWSRNDNAWGAGSQGLAELSAISAVLDKLDPTTHINVGLAMYTPGGGYIRFAPRDMAVAANKNALKAIVNGIVPQNDKVNTAQKNDSSTFYELKLYFSGLAPYTGGSDGNRDYPGNSTTLTPAGQGLTSGFALPDATASGPYNNPSTLCSKNYVIFVANSDNNEGDAGLYTYQTTTTTATAVNPGLSKIDAWASYLYTNSIAATFVLDVYGSSQNNASYSTVLQSAAKKGGGDYTQITGGNSTLLLNTLLRILANIQAVNTTFASTSLPVNTTNRSQDKNQVFIPMFRPDADARPRWMGNLKQYQLVSVNGAIELGDSVGVPAVNTLTGYPADCAASYWTTDSGTYWQNVTENPSPAGKCPTTSFDKFSDDPDGPIVEKGGVAEVIRKGNNPPSTNTTPTWAVNRTVYTQSGTALAAFNTGSSGLAASLVNFILGQDVNDENGNSNLTETRPSLHGDSIHSRPLPVDYGGTTAVTVYYGSNDGTLRAVDTTTGKERWAFIAPEFFPTLSRLMNNSPLVNYPGMPTGVTPTPTAKDYYFDGSLGLYQTVGNSSVWIYPSMRRGGRMIYALNVTNPASPILKWKIGCPNLTNDTGCTTGMSGIGQTWSMPNVAATVNGYTGPVVIVGGGYDGCEDADTATPTCTSPKGAGVYVIDADTGVVIKTFSTTRSVAADVALLAVTTVGVADHAYAVDTGGNIYRIDFGSSVSSWTINRVAYTNGAGRKFLFTPALAPASGGKVYVAIGSGDREHPLFRQYPYSGVTNRFYVYLDNLAATTANNLDDTASMQNFTAATTCDPTGSGSILPSSTLKGWFMNLNQNGQGEQTVTSALIAGGMATFSTNRPIPPVTGTCATTLGEARGYWVNLFNGSGAIGVTASCGGSRSSIFVGGGLPPSPVLGTVPVDGKATTVVIGAPQREGGANSPISPQQVNPVIKSTRHTIYWKSSGQN
jgi:type IV pilus assembly protein PilY1